MNTIFGNLDETPTQSATKTPGLGIGELESRLSSSYYQPTNEPSKDRNPFISRGSLKSNRHIWWVSKQKIEDRDRILKNAEFLSREERNKRILEESSVDLIEVDEEIRQKVLRKIKKNKDKLNRILVEDIASVSLALNPAIDETQQMLRIITDDNEITYSTKELWTTLNKVSHVKYLSLLMRLFNLPKNIKTRVFREYIKTNFGNNINSGNNRSVLEKLMSAYGSKKDQLKTPNSEE